MMIIKRPLQYATVIDKQGDCGVFDTMDDAIRLATEASTEYSKYNLIRKNEIIASVIKDLEYHLDQLYNIASREFYTISCDNIISILASYKNENYIEARLAANNEISNCENNMVNGIIVDSSTPFETLIETTILMVKAGHAIVFSSNKIVKNSFAYAVKVINNAIKAADGPKNLIVTIKEPSNENTKIMLEHENVTINSTLANNSACMAI